MRKELAVIFGIGIVVGVAVSVLGETNVVPPIGITQGVADGLYVIKTGDTVTGNLAVDGNTTLGDAAGDTVICNAKSLTFPNGLTNLGTAGQNVTCRGTTWTFGAVDNVIVPNADVGTEAMNRDTADARYVELAGDTMTGALRVGGNLNAEAAFIAESTCTLGDTTGDVVNTVANTWNWKGTAPVLTFENNATITVGAGVMTMTGQYNFGGPLLLSTLTTGSILFAAGSGNIVQDNIGLHYNDTTNSLGLGTATPDASTLLDMVSTSQCFGPPSMTTAQRDGITLPRTGGIVFDTTLNMSVENVGTPASPTWTGTGGGGPTIKSGVEASGSFSGNPLVATVTFGTAFSDANYSASIIGVDERTWTVDSQAAGSFVINTNAAQSITANVSWTAIAHFDP